MNRINFLNMCVRIGSNFADPFQHFLKSLDLSFPLLNIFMQFKQRDCLRSSIFPARLLLCLLLIKSQFL